MYIIIQSIEEFDKNNIIPFAIVGYEEIKTNVALHGSFVNQGSWNKVDVGNRYNTLELD